MKRIFVGYGHGGIFTSPAILGLAERLKPFGAVSVHSWQDFLVQTVAYVNTYGGGHVAAIGYSLSASALQDISERIGAHKIKLGVAIDASKQYYKARWDDKSRSYVQTAARFDRIICFWNPTAWIFGGAKYVGANVELHQINAPHLAAQALPSVWMGTEAAVKAA